MPGPEMETLVAGWPNWLRCCCKLKYAICRKRFSMGPCREDRASASASASAASASATASPAPAPTPLRFSISTYYRLTALCQRSGVKLLKKIAGEKKCKQKLVGCLLGWLPGWFLASLPPCFPPAYLPAVQSNPERVLQHLALIVFRSCHLQFRRHPGRPSSISCCSLCR